MRTTTVILLLALLCISSLARQDRYGRNRFRPSRDDYTEDPEDNYPEDNYEDNNGGDSWNDQPEENENSWDDNYSEDNRSWRRNQPRRQHNHRQDETEESNNEDSNTDSNVDSSQNNKSNTRSSTRKSSNNQASSNKASSSQSSNTQSSSSSSSTAGHLASDTFASTDYSADAKFKQQCLDIHNDERATLGIAPVTYNDDLAAAAKAWAEQLVQSGELSHSPNRVHVGENVGYRTHRDDVDSTPLLIGSWIDEKKDFENGDYPDISTTGSAHDVGHYSQVIWATTKEIGCAVVTGDDRDYMCCQYAPSGNRKGEPVY